MSLIVSYIKKAQLLLDQRRPLEAEKQLMQALGEEPENDQALSLLARCKYDQRQFLEGTGIVKQAIEIFPTNDYYFYLLGFGYYQLSQTEKAEESLQQAIRLNPYASDYFGLSSMILIEKKNYKESLDKANEGLALDPSNITCLNARSTALNKLRRTEDAIETIQFALKQDPENDFTHTNAGWNLLEKGRHKDAAQHFMEALRLNPSLENARTGLKESLKSAIPPYRWLLQYSFWINNQQKYIRWISPIAIYFIIRIIASTTAKAGEGWSGIGVIIVGIYIAFVFLSWILNPLANFTLMFHKRGKHALTQGEKWNSLLLMSSLALSGFFLCLALIYYPANTFESPLFFAFIIALTLGVPLGHMQIPMRFRHNSRMQWYSIILVGLGLTALAISLLAPAAAFGALIIYAGAFILYTWLSVFARSSQ